MALETLKALQTLQRLEQELDQELTQAIELKQALELELERERDLDASSTTATTSFAFDDAEMGKTPTQLENPVENTRPNRGPNQTDNTETRGGTIERYH